MEKLKNRWDITENWHLFFPFFGILLVLLTAYTIARRILHLLDLNNTMLEWIFTLGAGFAIYYLLLRFFLWCFKKLANKWPVEQRWEMIAIFIVFAVTGSISGKLAGPLTELIGLKQDTVSGWIFWTARILLIFPIYQILLVFFGWLFGQFRFFWNFEKKMLKRMGLGFLFN
ncbi:prolipoprotein diacylglyceryl transferase [Flagellimonas aquimarina]|jgi:hypothetical protein|uniref:Prolipoprotein diacylglyceryl transferase n=1 Tax=Flagellimonas aquimarina TaxID=2201895 RepID=A0A316KYS8_9FLAO|nr:DUF6787 family protein [Allomuricauda koreensis]PWL39014.1 prolipoprotein diacylglyceryl transferase [Allomuricauda koreensis]